MMRLFQQVRPFLGSLFLLVLLNMLIKPIWVFGIDRQVQNLAGLQAYGIYFSLMNLTMVLNFGLDLGITPFVNRELSTNPAHTPTLLQQALSFKLLLSALYTLTVFALAWSAGVADVQLLLLLVLLQILTSFLLLFRGCLTAGGQFRADALLSVFDKLLVIGVAGLWLWKKDPSSAVDLPTFVWIQLLSVLATIVLGLVWMKQRVSWSRIFSQGWSATVIKAGLPFALNVFFMTAFKRADGFLLERLLPDGAQAAGIYASAYRLIDTVNMMGFLVGGFLVAYIARERVQQPSTQLVIRLSRLFLLLPSVMIAAGGWFLADTLNQWLYHSASPETGPVIRILLLTLPGLAFVQIYGSVLTATGHIKVFGTISLFFAAALILTDLAVIPLWGARGAGWVATGMQTGYAAVVTGYTLRQTKIPLHLRDLVLTALIGFLTYFIGKWLFL